MMRHTQRMRQIASIAPPTRSGRAYQPSGANTISAARPRDAWRREICTKARPAMTRAAMSGQHGMDSRWLHGAPVVSRRGFHVHGRHDGRRGRPTRTHMLTHAHCSRRAVEHKMPGPPRTARGACGQNHTRSGAARSPRGLK